MYWNILVSFSMEMRSAEGTGTSPPLWNLWADFCKNVSVTLHDIEERWLWKGARARLQRLYSMVIWSINQIESLVESNVIFLLADPKRRGSWTLLPQRICCTGIYDVSKCLSVFHFFRASSSSVSSNFNSSHPRSMRGNKTYDVSSLI